MCTSPLSSFREQFPKNHRPEISDLERFWKPEVYHLFTAFAEYIQQEFDLRFGIPVWTVAHGWTYRIGKSGVYLFTGIQILPDGFVIDHIIVQNYADYKVLLDYVAQVYQDHITGFLKKIAEKNLRQRQRNQLRIQREEREFQEIKDRIVPGKYNQFHWPSKLDPRKLRYLYQLDAAGIKDDSLVDEVGLTFYLRCKLGKEDQERMDHFMIRCHHCGADLAAEMDTDTDIHCDNLEGGKTERRRSDSSQAFDFRQCVCGYQYSFREYRRSYRKNNMPTGAAAEIFRRFIVEWERAECYESKIVLIDALLHEFHRSLVSGAVHRPVAMNFIDGTRKNVEALIQELSL